MFFEAVLAHLPIRNPSHALGLCINGNIGIFANMTTRTEFLRLMEERLRNLNVSASDASIRAVGNHYLIRNIRRRKGAWPSVENLRSLCEVLGLEFYIGPPRIPLRSAPGGGARQISGGEGTQGDPLDNTVRSMNTAYVILSPDQRRRFLEAVEMVTCGAIAPIAVPSRPPKPPPPVMLYNPERLMGLADSSALAEPGAADEPACPASARPVPVYAVDVAAGVGAVASDPKPAGNLEFDRRWLDRRGLDSTRCAVMRVRGDSMEPTLPAGTWMLVDQASRERRDGRVYVVRSDLDDTLVVKRARRRDGAWLLASDNPAWDPVPWPETDAEVLGEVVWVLDVPEAG